MGFSSSDDLGPRSLQVARGCDVALWLLWSSLVPGALVCPHQVHALQDAPRLLWRAPQSAAVGLQAPGNLPREAGGVDERCAEE
eukprot:4197118-Pyramimonas_sp.AAC.1